MWKAQKGDLYRIQYSTIKFSLFPIKIVNDKGDIHEHSFDAGLLLTGRHDFLDGDGKSIEVKLTRERGIGARAGDLGDKGKRLTRKMR